MKTKQKEGKRNIPLQKVIKGQKKRAKEKERKKGITKQLKKTIKNGNMSKSWIFLSNVSELLVYAIIKLNIKKIIREECHDYSIQMKYKKNKNEIWFKMTERSLAA